MRTYDLNPEQAKQAESSRITETGKYVGAFTSAYGTESTKGTEGIEFAFKTDDGRTADFLTLWTYNKDGKELFGLKVLNALMTCLRAKRIVPSAGTIEKWEDGQRVRVAAQVFPDLTNKRIGLLLQREEYRKQDGSVGSKFNIVGAFDAETELTASEILVKASSPEKLAGMVASLRDKTLPAGAAPSGYTAASSGGSGDFDDDIPFAPHMRGRAGLVI